MFQTIEFEVKPSRVPVKQPRRRIFMPIKRADVFGDKRKKRTRTRQSELVKAIKEMEE